VVEQPACHYANREIINTAENSMFLELERTDYKKTTDLFSALEYNLSISSVNNLLQSGFIFAIIKTCQIVLSPLLPRVCIFQENLALHNLIPQ